MEKCVSASEALQLIQSEHRVFIHGAAATPHFLIAELCNQADRLKNVEIIHMHTLSQLLASFV